MPAEIWSSRLRVESKAGSGGGGGREEAGRHAALIKSRDPHLAGGEKHQPLQDGASPSSKLAGRPVNSSYIPLINPS